MSPELEDLCNRLDADSTAVHDDADKAAFTRWALMQQAAAVIREQADEIERLKADVTEIMGAANEALNP